MVGRLGIILGLCAAQIVVVSVGGFAPSSTWRGSRFSHNDKNKNSRHYTRYRGSKLDDHEVSPPTTDFHEDDDVAVVESSADQVDAVNAPIVEKWNEMNGYLHKVNRPKRLTVSTHSAFSTIVTGFFFGAVVPCLSPGFHENGLPRLYDFLTFDNAFLAKTTALMFAISAVTGVLRLPPNSTKLRRLMFESCAWATVLMYTLQDSNIFMLDGGYSLDIFDGPGWFVTFAVFVGTVISTLEYLVEGIAGSDVEGRESLGLPFEGHRFGMGVVGTLAYLGISPLSLTIPPWFFDRSKDAFESIVVPGLHMVNGWNLSVNFIVEAYMGFGMLVSTLLFEKKIDQNQAAILLMVNFFITGAYDQFAVLIPSPSLPTELADIAAYASSITSSIPINETFFSLWAVSIVKAIWQLNDLQTERRKLKRQEDQQQQQQLVPVKVPIEESSDFPSE